MSRLIDADALIAKQASIAKTFARSDAQKSLIGRVMYNTKKAPTIDAIPVEWLEAQINEAIDDNETELASDIGWLIRKYMNEQEAR